MIPKNTGSALPPWRQWLDSHQRRMAAWWSVRSNRERRWMAMGGLIVALALLWTIVLQPALNTIERARLELPRLQAQSAQIDALIMEAEALQRRRTANVAPAAITGALQTSLRQAGLDSTVSITEPPRGVNSIASEWEVQITDASATVLLDWLAGLPGTLRVSVVGVDLSRSRIAGRDQPGTVSGRIVLQGAERPVP